MTLLHFPLTDNKSSFIVIFPTAEEVVLKGKVSLKVLGPPGSSVQCLGHEITSKEQRVFSPKGFSLLTLQAKLPENGFVGHSIESVTAVLEGIKTPDLKAVYEALEETPASVLVLMTALDLEWTLRLDHYMQYMNKMALFGRETSSVLISMNSLSAELEQSLDVNLFRRETLTGVRIFEQGETWNEIAEECQERENCHILVMGGKGVGKSTFLRFLTNKLLAKNSSNGVLYIDLDPGQAEFSTPGIVSACLVKEPLLGPNFCNLDFQKVIGFNIGGVDVSAHRTRYLNSIKSIADHLLKSSQYKKVPWLINTMGFNTNFGLDCIIEATKLFEPELMISLTSRFWRKNYPDGFENTVIRKHCRPQSCKLVRVPAVPESKVAPASEKEYIWGHPQPRVLRDIVTLSHFSRIDPNARVKRIAWSDIAIQLQTPECISTSDILRVLNGSLISLESIPQDIYATSRVDPSGLRLLPNLDIVGHCLDTAIMLEVDFHEKAFLILSSLDLSGLVQVNAIGLGALKVPSAFITHHNLKTGHYLSVQDQSSNLLLEPWHRSSKAISK